MQYHGGLRSRELCQAPMLLVFLTPRQALSSHPRQCFCASLKLLFFMILVGVQINNFFKLLAPGIEPLTFELQVQSSPLHHSELLEPVC